MSWIGGLFCVGAVALIGFALFCEATRVPVMIPARRPARRKPWPDWLLGEQANMALAYASN